MLYRIDYFEENVINPITNREYDATWIIFVLNDEEYHMFCGSINGCAYTLKVSKKYKHWKMSMGDFISFNTSIGKNMIIIASEKDYKDALEEYRGHSSFDKYLREYEDTVLVHSTTRANYENILKEGCLYFDMKKIAEAGFLVRDGGEIKVKGMLPLEPYLLFAATWDKIGLDSEKSTPKIFTDAADKYFDSMIRFRSEE